MSKPDEDTIGLLEAPGVDGTGGTEILELIDCRRLKRLLHAYVEKYGEIIDHTADYLVAWRNVGLNLGYTGVEEKIVEDLVELGPMIRSEGLREIAEALGSNPEADKILVERLCGDIHRALRKMMSASGYITSSKDKVLDWFMNNPEWPPDGMDDVDIEEEVERLTKESGAMPTPMIADAMFTYDQDIKEEVDRLLGRTGRWR